MAHDIRCAQAIRPRCTCDCGGAMHGCRGAFDLAGSGADAVLAFAAQREHEWDNRPSWLTVQQAAIGCARADVVRWLHRDDDLRERAAAGQERAFEDLPANADGGLVLRSLGGVLGQKDLSEFQRWAGVTHFWCELLAQIACAIALYEDLRDRMIHVAESALLDWAISSSPSRPPNTEAIGIAVRATWRYLFEGIILHPLANGALHSLLMGGETAPLIWSVRVIAVLMCPDASKHEAVRTHCWEPIVRHTGAEIRTTVHTRLTEAFPEHAWPF